jgi:hypothetical protein
MNAAATAGTAGGASHADLNPLRRAGAGQQCIRTASYDKGILTVSVGLSQPKPADKRIPVQSVS